MGGMQEPATLEYGSGAFSGLLAEYPPQVVTRAPSPAGPRLDIARLAIGKAAFNLLKDVADQRLTEKLMVDTGMGCQFPV